jgi:hypothetical protein
MKARVGLLVALFFAALLMVPMTGVADERGAFQGKAIPVEVGPSPEPETYGTVSQTAMMLGSFSFEGRSSTTTIESFNGVDRYITSPGGYASAHPVLPNGASIEKIELRACDSSATDTVTLQFGPCTTPGGSCTLSGSVATGDAAIPGCGNFALTLVSPVQVDNQHPILVQVSTGTTSATTFSGVKIYYRLQVSPAPGVASFTDVPTSYWAFQYIEALKASGITQGVTPTTFEPESNVTRAQMAVFLAKALGLHFPN